MGSKLSRTTKTKDHDDQDNWSICPVAKGLSKVNDKDLRRIITFGEHEHPDIFPVPDRKTKKQMDELFKTMDYEAPMMCQLEKVEKWRRDVWPEESTENIYYPLIDTVGLTETESLRLSRIIYEATQPGEHFNYKHNELFEKDPMKLPMLPAIFVHQTNEKEIFDKMGSFRLNPFLEVIRYIEPQEERGESVVIKDNEANSDDSATRAMKCERKHLGLTLEEAYYLGLGCPVPGRETPDNVIYKGRPIYPPIEYAHNIIPILQSVDPIIGMPFNEFYRDIVELPECSLEMLKTINRCLENYGVQVIDLRLRMENRAGIPIVHVDENNTPTAAIEAVVRSLPALHSIRNTAKYFIVHTVTLVSCPIHTIQIIVRFKPGLPISPIDWVDDGTVRLKMNQSEHPPLRTIDSPHWFEEVWDAELRVEVQKKTYKIKKVMKNEDDLNQVLTEEQCQRLTKLRKMEQERKLNSKLLDILTRLLDESLISRFNPRNILSATR